MSTKTTKSHKTTIRDKPKHSGKTTIDERKVKKGGAGGKGTWGSVNDDILDAQLGRTESYATNDADPNFDPMDDAQAHALRDHRPRDQPLSASQPTATRQFALSIQDLSRFKRALQSAIEEYLVSAEEEEFSTTLKELDLPLYHQEIAKIVLKTGLDKSDQERERLSHLLHNLWRKGEVTSNQMYQGFKKLFNQIEDLVLDFPRAKVVLKEFLAHSQGAGYLGPKEGAELEASMDALEDAETVRLIKRQVASIIEEYFDSEELKEAKQAIAELNPAFSFEVVKKVISMALDRTNKEREMASVLLADLADIGATERGFTVLLSRVEDLFLDCPDILTLLSCFLARAMIDEALPPAFLSRVDLSAGDMGYQVCKQARVLLTGVNAGEKLARVWDHESEVERTPSGTDRIRRLLADIIIASQVPLPEV